MENIAVDNIVNAVSQNAPKLSENEKSFIKSAISECFDIMFDLPKQLKEHKALKEQLIETCRKLCSQIPHEQSSDKEKIAKALESQLKGNNPQLYEELMNLFKSCEDNFPKLRPSLAELREQSKLFELSKRMQPYHYFFSALKLALLITAIVLSAFAAPAFPIIAAVSAILVAFIDKFIKPLIMLNQEEKLSTDEANSIFSNSSTGAPLKDSQQRMNENN